MYADDGCFNDMDPIADEFEGAPGHRDAEPWVTTERAARYLDCAPRRVRHLIVSGRLGGLRDGRRLLTRKTLIDAYLRGEPAHLHPAAYD